MLQQFEQLCSSLMSPDNTVRGAAEQQFNEAKKHPDTLASALTQAMRVSQQDAVRSMSAVLIRRIMTRENETLWTAMQAATQQYVKTELVAAVESEPQHHIRNKICDTLSDLAALVLEHGGDWPELLPVMFNWTKSPRAELRESALCIFANLANSIAEKLQPMMGVILGVLKATLADPVQDVRLAALRATGNFLTSIEDENPQQLAPFVELLPNMLSTIEQALNSNEEQAARSALEQFVEIVDYNPQFFKKQLPQVLQAMLMITTTETLEDDTRHLALEFILSLAEKAPGMCRKFQAGGQSFTQLVLPVCMKFMLDIEDDEAWNKGTEEEDEEYTNVDVGEEGCDRLAIALGGKTILPVAFSIIPGHLTHQDWRFRHAALMAISQIGEGCQKQIEGHLGQVVHMALTMFGDPHPRVRFAAINCLGQLCTDFGGDLQEQFHGIALPALIRAMADPHMRVQGHAAAAVINFTEECKKETLAPYLNELLAKLGALLQGGPKIVQEQAITAIASIADCVGDGFIPYYDTFMPMFKHILTHAAGSDMRLLRGKAMECISLVGVAVGKAKFLPDAKEVMDLLMRTQAEPMAADDPQVSYMLQAWTRICRCLGDDFIPYLQVVMPPLIASAELKPEITVCDAEDEEAAEGFETIQIGDKRIGIKTSVLEEKATACNMICCYVHQLKDGFAPYVDQVAKLMVPLAKFYYSEEVRSAAVSCLGDLMQATSLALKKAGQTDRTPVKQLLDFIMGSLLEAIKAEPEPDVIMAMLDALRECVEVAGEGMLSPEQLKLIGEGVQEIIKDCGTRRKQRASKRKHEDCDEEETEALDDEEVRDDEILDTMAAALGSVMRNSRAAFVPVLQELLHLFMDMMNPKRGATERRIGVCIADDIIEHLGAAAHGYYDALLPFLKQYAADPEAEVRQAAVYGLGVAGKFGGTRFAPHCQEALMRLNAVITAPDSRSKENGSATDNAISAVGKIVEGQGAAGGLDVNAVLTAWVNYMPLTSDHEEARLVYRQLCTLIEANHPGVLGAGNANVPRILYVFGTALGTDSADEELTARFKAIGTAMRQGLPADVLAAAAANLSPEQRDKLQALLA
eukprot:tig00001030_g6453.t1